MNFESRTPPSVSFPGSLFDPMLRSQPPLTLTHGERDDGFLENPCAKARRFVIFVMSDMFLFNKNVVLIQWQSMNVSVRLWDSLLTLCFRSENFTSASSARRVLQAELLGNHSGYVEKYVSSRFCFVYRSQSQTGLMQGMFEDTGFSSALKLSTLAWCAPEALQLACRSTSRWLLVFHTCTAWESSSSLLWSPVKPNYFFCLWEGTRASWYSWHFWDVGPSRRGPQQRRCCVMTSCSYVRSWLQALLPRNSPILWETLNYCTNRFASDCSNCFIPQTIMYIYPYNIRTLHTWIGPDFTSKWLLLWNFHVESYNFTSGRDWTRSAKFHEDASLLRSHFCKDAPQLGTQLACQPSGISQQAASRSKLSPSPCRARPISSKCPAAHVSATWSVRECRGWTTRPCSYNLSSGVRLPDTRFGLWSSFSLNFQNDKSIHNSNPFDTLLYHLPEMVGTASSLSPTSNLSHKAWMDEKAGLLP